MPRVKSDYIPRSIKHSSGQAVVRLSGRDHYLGKWGSPQAQANYEKLIGEWLAHGRQLPASDYLSVSEVILAYVMQAQQRYGQGSELGCLKDALRTVKQLYGSDAAAEFGPRCLKTVRDAFIAKGWSRSYVNKQITRIRRVIKWAVAEELIPGEVYHRLSAVDGLRRGDPGARETEPVKPVPEAFVAAVKPCVVPQVRAMIELQSLTAMRPGEVTIMRTCDLETSGRVWVYKPAHHKTERHGHTREILLGPRAQEVLKPWLRVNIKEFLFQPAEAMAWRWGEQRKERKTPLWKSHVKMKERKKKGRKRIKFAAHYTVNAYSYAVRRGCKKAKVPAWSTNRLRHNAATNLRKEHGIELARIILGHSSAFTTEIYAEVDRRQAVEVIAKIG